MGAARRWKFLTAILLAAMPTRIWAADTTIVPLCTDATRLTAADLTGNGSRMKITAFCVDDAKGRSQIAELTVQAPFIVRAATLMSIYDISARDRFNINVAMKPSSQIATIQFTNGGMCSTIAATATKASPVPARFLGADKDWRPLIDYMVDSDCTVLSVRVGNRVAISTVGPDGEFDMYGIHFKISRDREKP